MHTYIQMYIKYIVYIHTDRDGAVEVGAAAAEAAAAAAAAARTAGTAGISADEGLGV